MEKIHTIIRAAFGERNAQITLNEMNKRGFKLIAASSVATKIEYESVQLLHTMYFQFISDVTDGE